ncbi:MAG: TlpA disulfide reductase family protein [Bacteroidales bacterium]|jgi:thiol-disulfide isomerase/thioredoxin
MKTNICYCLLFILFLIFSCTSTVEKNSKRFTIYGDILGQSTGKIILNYSPSSKQFYDTVFIKNGKFNFSGSIPEPTLAQITSEDGLNSADFYIEPGKMFITLSKNKFKDFKMTGSKTQIELDQLNQMLESINKKLLNIRKDQDLINKKIMNTNDRTELIKLQQEAKEYDDKSSSLRIDLNSTYLKFVQENPQSYITPYYLDVLAINGVIPYDSLKSIFYGLQSNIQNSKIGKKIQEKIRKKDNIIVGATLPDFTAIDLNNKTISLSQFKNKNVVIIDFWASWCEGCRAAFPHYKTLYNKYNSQGLEIVAFSFKDNDKEAWISAIDQDRINMWHHVATFFRNGDTINRGIVENYPLDGVPLTVLVGKNGKVLGSWLGYAPEYEQSLDKILTEIFKY